MNDAEFQTAVAKELYEKKRNDMKRAPSADSALIREYKKMQVV
jgi:hypothetical protein